MSLSDYLFLLICGLGVINSAVLAFYFIFDSNSNKSFDYYLAALLLCFSIRMAKHILVYFNQDIHPFYHPLWYFCFAFSAPVFFLAFQALIKQTRIKLKALLSHLLITVSFFLLLFYNELWAYYGILGLIIIYLLISFIQLIKWKKSQGWVTEQYNLVFSLMTFMVGIIAIHIYSYFTKISFFSIEALFFSLFIYMIAYRRFEYTKQVKRNRTGRSEPIPSIELSRHKQDIFNYFSRTEAYLNPQTTLPQTAKELKISHHLLSKVINEAFNLNFNDYINQFRVEHAKKLLLNANFDQYKISYIAEKSGFASTSAFNAAFKKFTKTTPSEFRQQTNN